DLELSVDFGAMGDFESSDVFTMTYSIDGAAFQDAFVFSVDENGSATYTLEGGASFALDDPLLLDGTVLTDDLATFITALDGTGDALTLRVTAEADGGSEALVFQNIEISGTPGTAPPSDPEFNIAVAPVEVIEGNSGTTSVVFTVSRTSGEGAASVDIAFSGTADAADLADGLPTGETLSFADGELRRTVTIEVNGDTEAEDDETLTATLSNATGAGIDTDAATATILDDDTIDLISTIQGSGATSTMVGESVRVQAIVTRLASNGFFLQEEDGDSDLDATTSEGIFVFTGSTPSVSAGDLVEVAGTVDEFSGATQIDSVTGITTLSTGNALPTAVVYALGETDPDIRESLESMRIELVSGTDDPITVVTNFNLDRYGEIVVAPGNQYQPTQLFDAQTETTQVQELIAQNADNQFIIDDGLSRSISNQNPDEFRFIPVSDAQDLNDNGYLDAGDDFTADGPTLRLGSEMTGPVLGILTEADGDYKMVVDGTLPIDQSTNTGARDATAPDVGGTLSVASFNVLNYFTTLGARGADSTFDFERQETKIVAAIRALDADIVGLQEIENNGFGPGSATATLVDALNEAEGADVWSAVDPTGTGSSIGTDQITTAMIYRNDAVTEVASDFIVFTEASNDATSDAAAPLGFLNDPGQRNRPAVAATFEETGTGERVTVVSNHFKSKGDSGLASLLEEAPGLLARGEITQAEYDAFVNDPNVEQGNGQGYWNQVRTDAATELKAWLEGTGVDSYADGAISDPDYLILGDLNAYAQEDPVQVFTDDPDYDDLVDTFIGQDSAYTFVFDGQRGSLDQGIASSTLTSQVTGAAEWHINADEPDLLNYSSEFTDPAFYEPSLFGASDHDPLIIGLELGDMFA
ncbi:ExeM/NucH family extracellular endonuclease, partial [Palleronia pelagia]